MQSFSSGLTAEEASRGFERAEHPIFGTIVIARIGHGLFALKVATEDGGARYQICDERGTVLYPTAGSLRELELRFALGDLEIA